MRPEGKARPTFLLLKARLPTEDPTRLIGRFVTHPARPLDNSEPSDPSSIIGKEIVEIEEEDTNTVLEKVKNSHVFIKIQGLVDLTVAPSNEKRVEMKAKSVKTYRLQNHYRAFDKLEADSTVRTALDGPKGLFTRSKGKLYMIVGIKTCTSGAQFRLNESSGTKFNTKVTVPISEALTLPVNVDPTIGAGVGVRDRSRQVFKTVGEQVFAVEYKIVTQRNIFGLYSAKEETTLAHNVMTFDWKNAVFSGKKDATEALGSFDDELEAEDTEETTDHADEKVMDMLDEELSAIDLRDEDFGGWMEDSGTD